MRIAPVVAVVCLLVISAAAQESSRGNPDIRFQGQSVDEMVAAYMRDHDVAGVSVAIVQAPYVTRATGFGVADAKTKTLVSAKTMFNVVEMRNAFTAVAAMQLVEEGKVDLSVVLPLIRDPRRYARLESLIENATQQSYERFVRERQLDRLGLKHTWFASELNGAPREALKPGQRHQRFLREVALIDPAEPAVGNGTPTPRAIYSSASDISFWDIALAGEILIKDAALRKLLYEPESGTVPSSGPWFFPGHPGLMVSTGSGEGFSSLLARFTNRDELICVTLLANREGLDLTQLARNIAGAYNPRTGPPAKAAGLRVQQSPYGVSDTIARLSEALRSRGVAASATAAEPGRLALPFGHGSVWQENGEVWVAATDPARADTASQANRDLRRVVDDALLEATGARPALRATNLAATTK